MADGKLEFIADTFCQPRCADGDNRFEFVAACAKFLNLFV